MGKPIREQASPDDPLFGSVFIFPVSDPPSRIGVAADTLDVGNCVTIEGVTGEVIEEAALPRRRARRR
jgi:hypothetical protein